MSTYRYIFINFFLLLGTFFPLFGETQSLESMSQGTPQLRSIEFPDSMHVQTEVQRLKKAKVIWINYALLRKMGIEIPEDEAIFKKNILDQFAWGIPQNAKDAKKNFTDEKSIFYADRYGGAGVRAALGSGRAASIGNFQSKGIGITPLVHKVPFEHVPNQTLYENFMERLSDFSHSHGGMSLTEGIREAEFGELLNEELPYGANRVAFLISTGTTTKYNSVYSEPRSILIRENSIRPAHFMFNFQEYNNDDSKEKKRVRSYLPTLEKSLIELGVKRQEDSSLNEAIKEFAKRLGEVYGTLYVRKIYRGAESPSNIEIDGRILDYGGLTLTPGYAKLTYAVGDLGDTKIVKESILNDFIQSLRWSTPAKNRNLIPKKSEIIPLFNESYKKTIQKEFLLLTGIPKEWVDPLWETEEGKAIGTELYRLSKLGNNKKIDSHSEIPIKQGKIDLSTVLPTLVTRYFSNDVSPISMDLKNIEKHFIELNRHIEILSAKENITKENLARYMLLASQKRNNTFMPLVRGMERTVTLMNAERMFKKGDQKYVQEYVSLMIEKGVKIPTGEEPFSLTMEKRIFNSEGITLSRAFNATTGKAEVWADFENSPASLQHENTTYLPVSHSGFSRFTLPDSDIKSIKFEFTKNGKSQLFESSENRAEKQIKNLNKVVIPTLKGSYKTISTASEHTVQGLGVAQKAVLTGFENCQAILTKKLMRNE